MGQANLITWSSSLPATEKLNEFGASRTKTSIPFSTFSNRRRWSRTSSAVCVAEPQWLFPATIVQSTWFCSAFALPSKSPHNRQAFRVASIRDSFRAEAATQPGNMQSYARSWRASGVVKPVNIFIFLAIKGLRCISTQNVRPAVEPHPLEAVLHFAPSQILCVAWFAGDHGGMGYKGAAWDPGDVGDEAWAFVVPYLVLCRENAPQLDPLCVWIPSACCLQRFAKRRKGSKLHAAAEYWATCSCCASTRR
jgi:hypothetical protein